MPTTTFSVSGSKVSSHREALEAALLDLRSNGATVIIAWCNGHSAPKKLNGEIATLDHAEQERRVADLIHSLSSSAIEASNKANRESIAKNMQPTHQDRSYGAGASSRTGLSSRASMGHRWSR